MGKYALVMGQYIAEDKTFGACSATNFAVPFMPPEDATLIGIRTVSSADAATTLQEFVEVKLTSTSFKPNAIAAMSQGSGLLTVPSARGGMVAVMDTPCEQPVKAGTPVTIECRNLTADTPVGVNVLVIGIFQS